MTSSEQSEFLRVSGLTVSTGMAVPDFDLATPLNLLYTGREASATTTMLTIAGRMKPKAGTVSLVADGEEYSRPRDIARRTALAGVTDIDGLDRNVSVASYVREVSAWTKPWYRSTPRDIANIPEWAHICELFDLDLDPAQHVGKLNPTHRFVLRVALAVLARPAPALVVIDDIDQVRSLEIRSELIEQLRALAQVAPVLVASTNQDNQAQFDTVISLMGTEA
ncbi:hypothetical protein WG915_00855 [Corynebacterium sp. H128]|uniref:hypothetical protein n=1 Tax=unclassified Corynebacterium TaxID=2624378 RepID=UPI003097799F